MPIPPEANEAVARARVFVAATHLDLGPVVACRHITKALLRDMLRKTDPNAPGYDIGVRLFDKLRECWVIEFAKKLPAGVVECPSTIAVKVYDDTGELELA